jgi:folate-binding Fe-S cluster repair protein YgfZ
LRSAYTGWVATVTPTLVRLDRGYVEVSGPDSADFLERMLSNEVASLEPGEARQALLLTPKGRIVAPLRAVRESADRFLLITEASLAEVVAGALTRARFAAKCEIEVKPYRGYLQLGPGEGVRNDDYGVEAFESWGEDEREAADPASRRRTSRSRKAATRARSRSRACTTAATRTAASACSTSTRSPATSWSTKARSSAV